LVADSFDQRKCSHWQLATGAWPDLQFIEILNVDLVGYDVLDDRNLVLHFSSGVDMHLCDHSNQYENMKIHGWII